MCTMQHRHPWGLRAQDFNSRACYKTSWQPNESHAKLVEAMKHSATMRKLAGTGTQLHGTVTLHDASNTAHIQSRRCQQPVPGLSLYPPTLLRTKQGHRLTAQNPAPVGDGPVQELSRHPHLCFEPQKAAKPCNSQLLCSTNKLAKHVHC